MKNFTTVFVLTVTTFTAALLITIICIVISSNKYKELKTDYDEVVKTQEESNFAYEQMNNYIDSLNTGFREILAKEKIIRLEMKENKASKQFVLADEITELENIIDRNKNRLSELELQLSEKDNTVFQLQSVIDFLNIEIEQKDIEIKTLKEELEASRRRIGVLENRVSVLQKDNSSLQEENIAKLEIINMQTETLEAQDKMLNEGYVIIGSRKELSSMNLIPNIGNKLNTKNLKPELGETVDIREFTFMTVNCKHLKVLSGAPESSYSIQGNGDGTQTLTVHSPVDFWGNSHYLVLLQQ